MIGILRNESIVNLRVLPPIGLKAQHRFTPRELSNSIPRIPVLEPEALAMFDEIEDLPLEQSITPNSTMSTEEQMITDIQRSHAEIANSLRHSNHVKLRQPKKRPNCSPKRQKELFEIKRKSFEAAEKRLSSSGPSEELPRVLSRDSSPIRTVSPAVVVPVAPSRNERRSWHGGPMGGKCPEGLTAAELLNLDKFEHSPNDTASSGERKPAFRSPLKLQTKSTPEATRRPMPRHVLSINRPRNEIVFFKANPSTQVKHPPSRRKETARRNRSVPRSSDKVTQDLLKLITEPVTPLVRHQQHQAESTDDDQSPKKDNPEHLPEADRQYVSLYNGSSESPQLRQGRNKQRRKSLQSDPVTDERLHRIEKTLREMQLKLDEEQSRNHQLESQVKTLRHENYQMKLTKTHQKQDYV